MANRHNNIQDVYSIIEKGPISRIELISKIKAELPYITSYNKVFNSLINRNMVCVSPGDIFQIIPLNESNKSTKPKRTIKRAPKKEIVEKFASFSPIPELKKPVNLYKFSYLFVKNMAKSAIADGLFKLSDRNFKTIDDLIKNYVSVRNVKKPYTFEKIFEETIQSFATSSAKRIAIDFIGRREKIKEALNDYNVKEIVESGFDGIDSRLAEAFENSFVWHELSKCIYSQALILNTFKKASRYIKYLKEPGFSKKHDGKSFVEYQFWEGKKYSYNAPEGSSKKDIQINYCAVYGFGGAIAPNYMKEIGFDYGKPDTHLLFIMSKIGLIKDDKDIIGCQGAIKKQSKFCKVTSYAIDKLLWLCCSGFFYRDYNGNYLGGSKNGLKDVFINELIRAIKDGLVKLK